MMRPQFIKMLKSDYSNYFKFTADIDQEDSHQIPHLIIFKLIFVQFS